MGHKGDNLSENTPLVWFDLQYYTILYCILLLSSAEVGTFVISKVSASEVRAGANLKVTPRLHSYRQADSPCQKNSIPFRLN